MSRLNIKMSIFSKLIYRYAIPIRILAVLLAKKTPKIDKSDPKIHMELQGSLNSQNNLKKEEQSCSTHTS